MEPFRSNRALSLVAQNQFFSSYRMLETLVDVTPDAIWYGVFNDVPYWYQVYHVAYFVDYWFRAEGATFPTFCMAFDPRIPPEFEHAVPEGVSVSRADLREYLRRIRTKLSALFAGLDDAILARAVRDGAEEFTLLDVFVGQTRHIMYNIGYCNGILRERDLEESDWYSYNEPLE